MRGDGKSCAADDVEATLSAEAADRSLQSGIAGLDPMRDNAAPRELRPVLEVTGRGLSICYVVTSPGPSLHRGGAGRFHQPRSCGPLVSHSANFSPPLRPLLDAPLLSNTRGRTLKPLILNSTIS